MKAVCITGLPGSGKTTRAKEVYEPKGYMLFDDPSVDSKEAIRLQNHLSWGEPLVVICDPQFCLLQVREKFDKTLRHHGYSVKWEFFENDAKAARLNVNNRNDGRVCHVEFVSSMYNIPTGAKTMSIWQPPQQEI